uniref:Syndecan n=1 Tax=Cyanistes caeruleus TaxID=156563 RepID=A0A8C0UZ27_CYACU
WAPGTPQDGSQVFVGLGWGCAAGGVTPGVVLPVGLLGLCWSWLRAQRWRNENYERPVDLEGSGDDDPFGEDELDDIYSGSGSGCEYLGSSWEGFLDRWGDPGKVLGWLWGWELSSETKATGTVPEVGLQCLHVPPELGLDTAVSLTTDTLVTLPTTAAVLPVTAAQPVATPLEPSPTPQDTATTRATTLETPTTPVPDTSTPTEVATSRLVPSSTAKPRALPKPSTSRTAELPEKSTALPPVATTLPPTEVTAVPENELEVPASSGPSGDFEIREEEETTRPDLRNEVMAVVTPPAGPGPGRNVETGLMDNTIDSGNSAAQLPQKNILERKEVLIAVIVGGVVGALFAAFLVMLLIYRMKKKDEGSYTLEEPKQANVTYQKPDKQEEFYA